MAPEKDEYGLPLPLVNFSYSDNDRKLIDHAVATMQEIFKVAGGTPKYVVPDTAHLMGGCRMGKEPQNSVTDERGRKPVLI